MVGLILEGGAMRAGFVAGAGEDSRAIVPGDAIEIDFARGGISFRDRTFRFAPLGAVPQALVVAGGVENQVRRRLGL